MQIKLSSLLIIMLLFAECNLDKQDWMIETLLTIEPTESQPRNSEGDIIELNDGRLCLVYTRFTGGAGDHSHADLAMRTSSDDGHSWSDDRILVANEGGCNVMSVSTLRLQTGEILLFYLRKDSDRSCNPFVRRSSDELQTLSEAKRVSLLEGYHVVNNDRVVQLSSGRLIVPAVLHTGTEDYADAVDYNKGIPFVYYSDDHGWTWMKDNTLIPPLSERKLTLQENGVVELENGQLWMFMRTTHGYQYGCFSNDNGLNWTEPSPTTLSSPRSPATIERIPWTGDLLCVWNDHSGLHPFPPNRRTPLCLAISKDEGRTWSPSRVIEENPLGWYCYTSMTFIKNRIILSYCAGDEEVGGLNRLKVIALHKM